MNKDKVVKLCRTLCNEHCYFNCSAYVVEKMDKWR